MKTQQLRIYTMLPGKGMEFARWWSVSMPPYRAKYGFSVEFAYLSDDQATFIWCVSAPGDETAFAEFEKSYLEAPEREAILESSPGLASQQVQLVHAVTPAE